MHPVEFDAVWKKFRRGERHDSLRDLLPAVTRRLTGAKKDSMAPEEFWALRDVSFRLDAGEALGVIGPNGAGKSTVLKLLTKILRPTRGSVAVGGRIGALIEVAAGFHPDLTGRENVYLQGAVMGMSRAEIGRKFADIVDFSGVADFIDTPVKRYSSGMNARLGFAIAAHLDPDVLVIDEVLAVGDVQFQAKCVERMKSLLASGIPLVFVSHNLSAVVDLCTRALLIEKGTIRFDGSPAEAVSEFRRHRRDASDEDEGQEDRPIRITDVRLLHGDREASSLFVTGRPLTVQVGYHATRPIVRPQVAVDVHNADGVYCAGINTRMDDRDLGVLEGSGRIELAIPRLWLLPGAYSISVGIHDTQGLQPYDLQLRAYPFAVVSERRDFGVVYLEHEWRAATAADSPHSSHPIRARATAVTARALAGIAATEEELS
jgi:lipopolysaccharide transport system ATP-binding protein